jgi:hypothetical protein
LKRQKKTPQVPLDWKKSVKHAIEFVAPAGIRNCPSTENLEWRAEHLRGFRHSVPPEPHGLSPRLTLFSGGVAYWIEDVASVEHARLEIVLRAHNVQQSMQNLNPSPDLLEEVNESDSVGWSATFEAAPRSVARWERDVRTLEDLIASNVLCSRRIDGQAFVSAEIDMNRGIRDGHLRRSEYSRIGPHQRTYWAQQAALYDELLDSLRALQQRL